MVLLPPPPTERASPVMDCARGEHRYDTTLAISLEVTILLREVEFALSDSSVSGVIPVFAESNSSLTFLSSVTTNPGRIALVVIQYGPSSSDKLLVRLTSAMLRIPALIAKSATPLMLIILPQRF